MTPSTAWMVTVCSISQEPSPPNRAPSERGHRREAEHEKQGPGQHPARLASPRSAPAARLYRTQPGTSGRTQGLRNEIEPGGRGNRQGRDEQPVGDSPGPPLRGGCSARST